MTVTGESDCARNLATLMMPQPQEMLFRWLYVLTIVYTCFPLGTFSNECHFTLDMCFGRFDRTGRCRISQTTL